MGTIHGLPYPDPEDRVIDGDDAMQALAEAIAAGAGDQPLDKLPRGVLFEGVATAVAGGAGAIGTASVLETPVLPVANRRVKFTVQTNGRAGAGGAGWLTTVMNVTTATGVGNAGEVYPARTDRNSVEQYIVAGTALADAAYRVDFAAVVSNGSTIDVVQFIVEDMGAA